MEAFSRYWPFVRGIHQSRVNSPHKDQWCGALMFSLICVWINGWVNTREASDLRRYHAHYDVIVMFYHNWPKKSTWFRKVAWRQTSDRPLPETMFSIRSHTSYTPEGTVVMLSIIIQYGTQWLRATGINLCVLTRDTHKSVRVGVSTVKFHQIILFLLFFIYLYCRIQTWWNPMRLHNITR